MRQLSFLEQSSKENFMNNLEDLRLYLKALDGITATILRDLKKRNNSVISAETLASVVYSVATECNEWAARLIGNSENNNVANIENFLKKAAST